MKNILLLGAGKSATVLIDYLKKLAAEKNYSLTIADADYNTAAAKAGVQPHVQAVQLNLDDETARKQLIKLSDIVISLMPPALHYTVAIDCLELHKNLLTASYIDDATKALANEAKQKGLLFLYEMGLDPGIDHMSAMQIIDDIHAQGGKITSFKSHCGGLVAPESDDNPWHYKISWNPRNVVMAGKAGATYLNKGHKITEAYEQLFSAYNLVVLPTKDVLAFYPNRDSLSYIDTYHLKDVSTFIRTTLRYPEFNLGWKNIIDLKLTNEDKIYDTNGMSLDRFFQIHFAANGYTEWLDNLIIGKLRITKTTIQKFLDNAKAEGLDVDNCEAPDDDTMFVNEQGELRTIKYDELDEAEAAENAKNMDETAISLKQLLYLGMADKETIINKGLCSAADVMQFVLEEKLVLKPHDKDMIVMLHEFEYELNGKKHWRKSLLKLIGENSVHTAMAKTVGLPLGIAANLILSGVITETGLHIPILPSIYEPVLQQLQTHDIMFKEFF